MISAQLLSRLLIINTIYRTLIYFITFELYIAGKLRIEFENSKKISRPAAFSLKKDRLLKRSSHCVFS